MPQELPLEKTLEQALNHAFDKAQAKSIFADYVQVRDVLATQVLRYIVAAEPNLTDHGVDHIKNVLQNIHLLLRDDVKELNAVELYTLIISVLFHDVGNLFGRKNHQNKISDIYEHIRKKDPRFSQEKCLVLKIVAAHTGEANDGSGDTLNDLDDTDNLYDNQVRSRTIAALLRLADELAEGHQRTSNYVLIAHGFKKSSAIFHDYAQITQIHPDRGNHRIALTFNFRLRTKNGKVLPSDKLKFLELLKFTYGRIVKLDEERKYAKHYTPLLEPFKKTSIRLNFHLDTNVCNLDLGDLTLSDKVVPGGAHPQMVDLFPKCDPASVWKQLRDIKLRAPAIKFR